MNNQEMWVLLFLIFTVWYDMKSRLADMRGESGTAIVHGVFSVMSLVATMVLINKL